MEPEIKRTIRISVAELSANQGRWGALIDAYIQDAVEDLYREIYTNGAARVAEYRKAKEK